MPFSRPTLTDLRNQVAADITAELPGADALLRFSNVGVLGKVFAGLTNGNYGYLDWIALQATPFSATDLVYITGWAGLKAIVQKLPQLAGSQGGAVTFTGTNGAVIPDQTEVVRSDGVKFLTQGAETLAGGAAACDVLAELAGSNGNSDVGVVMSLSAPIAGVASSGAVTTAVIGGTDLETTDSFRSRMLQAYAAPPAGGSRGDYVTWALAQPYVTRAWVTPQGMGPGTVVVYVMLDELRAAEGGFPQGTDGCATLETRGAAATGDQLGVANALFPLQPALSLVYVVAPTPDVVNFTISGLPGSAQAAAEQALADVFAREASPGGVFMADGSTPGIVRLAHCWTAIVAATGYVSFTIVAPVSDPTAGTGDIPTLGTVAFE